MRNSDNWLKTIINSTDVLNTFNGGMSQPKVKLEKQERQYLVTASIPEVSVENIKVDVVDNHLQISHHIGFQHANGEIVKIPHLVANILLNSDVNVKGIKAMFEDEILKVHIPFNELESGFRKNIEIER